MDAEIPVMGHIGLTPQSVNAFGGFRVQARDDEAAALLVEGAEALAAAGALRRRGRRASPRRSGPP